MVFFHLDRTMVVAQLVLLWNLALPQLKLLRKLALPIFFSGFISHLKSIISMLCLAYLGSSVLAAGSLAMGFANITGYSVMKGLAVGMEPLCSQAYGARKWALFSQTFRQTLCLLFIAAIPITLLWLNMEPVLLLCGQDRAITSIAKVFIAFSIPELFAQALLHPLRIFIKTQSQAFPITKAATLATLLHIPITYVLAIRLGWGIKGVAIASSCHTLNFNAALLVHLFRSRTAIKPWNGRVLTTSFYRTLCPLLKQMFQSVCSVCLEFWWYEIMVLLCGMIENPEASVAAMGILLQLTGLLYVFPSSLASALSTRVGQELGAEAPAGAKQTTMIGILIAVVGGLLSYGCTFAMKDVWGKLYTREPQVVALTSLVLPILGLCEVGNCPQTAACGVLLGSARSLWAATINFCAFYLVGLPVATYMIFRLKKGLRGLWYGLAAAQATCVCMMIATLVFTDWEAQASRARELTEAAGGSKNDLEAHLLEAESDLLS